MYICTYGCGVKYGLCSFILVMGLERGVLTSCVVTLFEALFFDFWLALSVRLISRCR